MTKEGKEAYWILYSESQILDNGKTMRRHYWHKVFSEEAMWKFVASFSRRQGTVWHVIKGCRIKVN